MSANAASNSVLCAGRLYCDLVFTGVPNLPSMGTETFAENLSLHAGGGAFITAATFSALGWNASLLATLPSAPFDGVVCREIEQVGVLTNLCRAAEEGAAPQLTVAIAGKEDRAFLSNKSGCAVPEFDMPTQTFKHLHIGELRSLVEHPNLIEKARSAGMTISLDCSWDADLLARGSELNALVSNVDVFLPNESEFSLLVQSGLDEGVAPLTIVKCGNKGARAFKDGMWIDEPTSPTIVVDATGAGDAFNGGFLSDWLSGKALRDCLKEGNRCGLVAVGQTGGIGGMAKLRESRNTSPIAVAHSVS